MPIILPRYRHNFPTSGPDLFEQSDHLTRVNPAFLFFRAFRGEDFGKQKAPGANLGQTKTNMEKETQVATVVKKSGDVAKSQGAILDLLNGDKFKAQVSRSLPTHLKPDRFLRIACTTVMRVPKLKECEPASFFSALLTLSQLGLEPDGRRAHLIPFNNKRRGCVECQLIVDYKGLVELVLGSGKISHIHADTIRENDVFEYDKGRILNHKIDFRKPRGEVYAVYAIATTKEGQEKCEVMSKEDIEAIRARSRSREDGPWATDWDEMAKKTVFRRLSKWLPLTPEQRDSVEVDDEVWDVESSSTVSVIDGLIDSPEPQKQIKEPDDIPMEFAQKEESVKKAEDTKDPETSPPQAILDHILDGEKISFDTFMRWANDAGQYPKDKPEPASVYEVDSTWLARWLKSTKVFMRQVEIMKGGVK